MLSSVGKEAAKRILQEHGEYDQEKACRTRIDGSKIPSQCYGNYWVALEEQTKNDEECECEDEDEEEYGI